MNEFRTPVILQTQRLKRTVLCKFQHDTKPGTSFLFKLKGLLCKKQAKPRQKSAFLDKKSKSSRESPLFEEEEEEEAEAEEVEEEVVVALQKEEQISGTENRFEMSCEQKQQLKKPVMSKIVSDPDGADWFSDTE